MNKEKILVIPVILIIMSMFYSCSYMTGINSLSVKRKTSMGNFEHLNDPIVCSFTVKTGINKYGTIYYVFDWEKDEIYDFVFDKNPTVNWREIKVGKKYLTASTAGYAYLDSETGKVTYHKLDFYSYLFHEETDGDLGFIYETIYSADNNNGNGLVKLYVFDSKTGLLDTEGQYNMKFETNKDFFQIDCDKQGIFWVSPSKYNERYKTESATFSIVRIDLKNRKTEEIIKNTNIYHDENDIFFNENVLCISDDFIITNYFKLGYHPINNYYLNFYDKKTYSSKPVKKIYFPEKEEFHLYDGVVINNTLYLICSNRSESKKITEIYKVDLNRSVDEYEIEYVTRMNIDFTENIYVRGSRIYLLSSRLESNFVYMWYDTATGAQSEWKGYDVEQMVELWASGDL